MAAGCLTSDGTGEVADSGDADAVVFFDMTPLSEDEELWAIRVTITADDMETIERNFPITDAIDTGEPYDGPTVTVPTGLDRTILVEALDGKQEIAYSGSTVADLLPGAQRVEITVRGFAQIGGGLYDLDRGDDLGLGDPVENIGSGESGATYEVTSNEEGRFSFELPTGPEVLVYAGDETGPYGFALVHPMFGGQDIEVLLIQVLDSDFGNTPFLIQGVVSPVGAAGRQDGALRPLQYRRNHQLPDCL
ncbi:MAG: hypothetical protein M5R36_19780 [Deltaproteobacteria bacterium]|nr:hypothetical protein [Deltaproteobacteria bacterium]